MNSAPQGPFRVEETAGVVAPYWTAIDPFSGICTDGRASKAEAERDCRALNAAYIHGLMGMFNAGRPHQQMTPRRIVDRAGKP